jgi:hypothetical protein
MDNSRNRKLGAIAVAVVALVGVGAAVAASQLHGGGHASAATQGSVAPAPRQQGAPPAGGPFGRPDGYDGQRRGFGLRGGGGLSAASTYLGISGQQLFTDLQSGKTLAQIANATSGKSAAGLIDAMVAAEKTRIAAAVKSGYITQAMATQIESNLGSRVTQMVNGSFGFGRGRGGFGPPGGGGFGGPPTQAGSASPT